ncbi:formate dehydrogenase subunit D [Pontibacillus halophilus JSM 076056 = DSM 19796]|uniref:Sulfur carrier protein FdhD n=1 Tax=Pontibacillus halophilus JSM 076056 = DSM 19796 TaxID=1385510 RepID=A0A0A5I714_9BACI|nr:formate dehydrogenase accessory sulfurtransferase FdhD [Pontibacillus halophilus]KGX91627.1 formate dehydrogenase subunit D [Pontibacillus halophilus JSM 076056 = DSM 19796]
MELGMTTKWTIHKYEQGHISQQEDEVAIEFALTVHVNGIEYATMVCSPFHLEELVIGFLASEGIIRTFNAIHSLHVDIERGYAYVELQTPLEEDSLHRSKRFIGSCCGKSREFYYQEDAKTARTVYTPLTLTKDEALHLMKAFQDESRSMHQTGGIHQASIAVSDSLVFTSLDIGRHNALDKCYGYMLKENLPRKDKVIVFSGRLSSEVVLKVSKMGVGIVLSPSAPTDLALRMAEDLQVTALGFVRRDRFNVYTWGSRIVEHNALDKEGEKDEGSRA